MYHSTEREYWNYTPTITHIARLFGERMFPLTLGGISEAINALKKPQHAPMPA